MGGRWPYPTQLIFTGRVVGAEEAAAILKAAFRELDGAQGRVAHENELLEVFQRKAAGLPQGPRTAHGPRHG